MLVKDLNPHSVSIYTDSQALVRGLKNVKASVVPELEDLKSDLVKIAEGRKVMIQWTPAHVGTAENEEVDKQGKGGESGRC